MDELLIEEGRFRTDRILYVHPDGQVCVCIGNSPDKEWEWALLRRKGLRIRKAEDEQLEEPGFPPEDLRIKWSLNPRLWILEDLGVPVLANRKSVLVVAPSPYQFVRYYGDFEEERVAPWVKRLKSFIPPPTP